MGIRHTPPMECFGIFLLEDPWLADPAKCYRVRAIRNFNDLRAKNILPYELAYKPYGATQALADEDEANDVCIVSLFAEDGTVIYVPDSRIVSYPNMGNHVYRHVVLSISLSAIPDGLSLEWLKTKLAEDVTEIVGVSSTVIAAEAPVTDTVSEENHQRMEAARTGAKKAQVTTAAQLAIAKNQLSSLTQKYKDLEAVVLKNDLIKASTTTPKA